MASLLRKLGKMKRAAPVLSRGFTSFKDNKDKLNEYVKKVWAGLEERARGAVYDTVGRCLVVGVSGGTGWMWLGKPMSERQDKLEERMNKLAQENWEMNYDLRVQLYKTEEALLKWMEEADVKNQKLQQEMKEVKYLRELWMATAYLDSAKRAEESKKP